MLSKTDILREIGDGISIYPLILDNIKENSINLSASRFAWASKSQKIYYKDSEYDKNKRFSLCNETGEHEKSIDITMGHTAVVSDDKGNQYIILLPMSTTLIETEEVLALNNNIGGTYHSKVGLVSKGIGHIGTMVGPNFSGDSLVALHNVSNNLIVIKVGDTFVSVVFHYLDTPYKHINPTISGHTEKFLELGIHLSEEDLEELNEDWKKKINEVQNKLKETPQYKELKEQLKKEKIKTIRNYFNIKNTIKIIVVVAILVVVYFIAYSIDKNASNTIWQDRFFNVGCSGILVAFISFIFKGKTRN